MENSVIDGRYRLLNALGSGGEARVFRAQDTATGSDVAVRLALRPATATLPADLPVFHPGWVELLGHGIDSEFGAYQVFELLEGETLRQIITAGPFDADDWRFFVEQSLDATEALHAAGHIHGDLNADNFIYSPASGPAWKLLELPFLCFDPPAGRSPVFGSIHTLAPEQFNGRQPDALSDLYALGCLYYYAASGAWPHPGTNSREVAISCLRFTPIPLAEKATDLPPAWCQGVMKLIALQPHERPSSVAAARQLLGVA